MQFDTEGREFDLRVQRFLRGRWETDVGQRVRQRVLQGLKDGVEIRAILDEYILDHSDNSDPYGHPIYPLERENEGEFWVLHPDDLRGISFYNEDFSGSPSFEKKNFDYARFFNCNFSRAEMEMCSLTRVYIEECDFSNTIFAHTGGFYTRFRQCTFSHACFWMAYFIDAEFYGCDLQEVYFEDVQLIGLTIDHQTEFGDFVARSWEARTLPLSQLPDIYRAIRIAYEKAELYDRSDKFLYKERTAFRKYILASRFKERASAKVALRLCTDLIWSWSMGYATKPFRMLLIGIFLIAAFTLFYWSVRAPYVSHPLPSSFVEYLYFSITSFATLGYGDLAFGAEHPWLRLVSASEAMCGGAWIAVFISVLSRKFVR